MVGKIGWVISSILETECVDDALIWAVARYFSFSRLARVCYVFGGIAKVKKEECRRTNTEG